MTATPGLPRHLKWLLVIGVLVTALVVVSVVETLRTGQPPSNGGVTPGFYVPRSDKPVEFSLPPVSSAATTTPVTMKSELGKPVVLNLWSTTCTVCAQETPAIEKVARQYGSKVNFVGIDTLDSAAPARAFVERYGVTYQELFDSNAVVANGYGVSDLPVSFFITASGKVVGANLGALTTASLDHYITTLLGVRAGG